MTRIGSVDLREEADAVEGCDGETLRRWLRAEAAGKIEAVGA